MTQHSTPGSGSPQGVGHESIEIIHNFKLFKKSAHVDSLMSSVQTSPLIEVRAQGQRTDEGYVTHSKLYFWCLIAYLSLSLRCSLWGNWVVSGILNVGHLISFLFFSSQHSMVLFVRLPRFHAWTQSEIYILKRLYCSPFRKATDEHHKSGWGEGKCEREKDRDATLYFLLNRCITNYSLNAVSHIGNFTQTSLSSLFIN